MARLTTVRPGLVLAPSRLTISAGNDREKSERRRGNDPWRAWYGLKRWKDIRWDVLVRDLFTCQFCGHMERDTSLLVCDHVDPHRGDPVKFWNGPFETLCQQCHSIDKQSQESGATAHYHPDWLRPSNIPLTIICGGPASGKTTYARQRAGQYDVIIDLDVIAQGLSGCTTHMWSRDKWLKPAVRKRNAMLAYLSRTPRWKRAWFIVSEPKADDREWWNKKLRPQSIIVMMADAHECKARIGRDETRDQSSVSKVDQWLKDYTPREGDTVIRS